VTLHPRVTALFPVFGGEMATAKIQPVKGSEWIFRALCEKILLGLDGLDRWNGDRTGIVFSGEVCYTWPKV
jgi:hypothetical protein